MQEIEIENGSFTFWILTLDLWEPSGQPRGQDHNPGWWCFSFRDPILPRFLELHLEPDALGLGSVDLLLYVTFEKTCMTLHKFIPLCHDIRSILRFVLHKIYLAKSGPETLQPILELLVIIFT